MAEETLSQLPVRESAFRPYFLALLVEVYLKAEQVEVGLSVLAQAQSAEEL